MTNELPEDFHKQCADLLQSIAETINIKNTNLSIVLSCLTHLICDTSIHYGLSLETIYSNIAMSYSMLEESGLSQRES